MASAVGVPDRVLALRQRRGGRIEHGVRELRVRRGRHGPADGHPVEAVHDGAEIDLAGGYPELGDVGEPQRVGRIGVEVALHQVLRGVGYLAFVGAVPSFPAALGDQVELAHQPCDDLLRDPHALAPQVQADSAIAVAAVAGGEDLGYAPPRPRMLVRSAHGLDLVLVAASAHAELCQYLIEPARRPRAVRDQGLLPVRRHSGVDALVFSQELDRPFQDRLAQLEPLDLLLQLRRLRPERIDVVCHVLRRGLHLAGRLLPEKLVLPFAEDRPGDARGVGRLLRRRLPRCERDDGLPLLVVGERARLGAPAAPAGLQLVHPAREQLLGFRVSELADGAGEALPAIEEVVDGGPLLEVIAAPMASSAQVPVFRELHVPQPEGMAVGIAELVYGRRRAPVVSKVELERPHLVLVRIHLMSFPTPNRYGFLSASPVSSFIVANTPLPRAAALDQPPQTAEGAQDRQPEAAARGPGEARQALVARADFRLASPRVPR